MSDTKHTTGKSLRQQVEKRFDQDFNTIDVRLLEKAYPNGELVEYIIYPDNYDFESEEEGLYPCWNYLFEARDSLMSDCLKENVNALADLGIHLMQVDETNAMMFIAGAGYCFYDQHWIPLYRDILKWVK